MVVTDPSSPNFGNRPILDIYTGIGPITTSTRDTASYSVTVVMNLQYDTDDATSFAELSGKQKELQDFVRDYLSEKYVSDLKPENKARLKQDIQGILNNRFLDSGKISMGTFF